MSPTTAIKERRGNKSDGRKTSPRKQGKRPAEKGEKNEQKRKDMPYHFEYRYIADRNARNLTVTLRGIPAR
jgi:hypothetical protein